MHSQDDNIGRLLDFLDESGLAENTVVGLHDRSWFFLGDHGWHYRLATVDALVFTNDASTTRRILTVKLSYDGGITWVFSRMLNAGPSGYSTVIQLSNGEIGVLHERGDSDYKEWISFAHFPIAWVRSGADQASLP